MAKPTSPSVEKSVSNMPVSTEPVVRQPAVSMHYDRNKVVKHPRFVLHVFSWAFSIVALACTAAGYAWPYDHASWTEFLLFVAASSFILDMLFVGVYLMMPKLNAINRKINDRTVTLNETAITLIWAVFWLAGATAFTVHKPAYCVQQYWWWCDNATVNAAIVFSYLAFGVWAVLLVILARDSYRIVKGMGPVEYV